MDAFGAAMPGWLVANCPYPAREIRPARRSRAAVGRDALARRTHAGRARPAAGVRRQPPYARRTDEPPRSACDRAIGAGACVLSGHFAARDARPPDARRGDNEPPDRRGGRPRHQPLRWSPSQLRGCGRSRPANLPGHRKGRHPDFARHLYPSRPWLVSCRSLLTAMSQLTGRQRVPVQEPGCGQRPETLSRSTSSAQVAVRSPVV